MYIEIITIFVFVITWVPFIIYIWRKQNDEINKLTRELWELRRKK